MGIIARLSLGTIIWVATSVAAHTQSLQGITSIRDTSYSNRVALEHVRKTNPNAQLAGPFVNAAVAEKKNIVYGAAGDRKLLLDVFHPIAKATTPRTAILIIHGGGWRSGSRSQHYALAQQLAALGYVCFTPEYRLSTEALFPAAVYDLKAAIRWVRKNAAQYQVDTGRITAMGFSAGGELAAFMGTTGNMPLFEGTNGSNGVSSRVNAVVDLDGTLSFVHREGREGNDTPRPSAATYWFGYPKLVQPKLWEAASPLSYVSAATPPTLFVNSSLPWMHAGREDYLKVLQQHQIYSEVKTFDDAPHHFPMLEPWFTPMVGTIDAFLKKAFTATIAQQPLTRIVVSPDGSGHYRTIQEAVNAVRAYSPVPITIFIKNGVYHEKLVIPTWVTGLTIIGESREKTIITNADFSGKPMHADTTVSKEKFSTFNSYTVKVQGNDTHIENLTIENAAGRVGQGVALHVDGDRFVMRNCDLLGNQDTLLTANDTGKQYYQNCLIAGTTDFIFGNATVIFDHCIIKSLMNSYVTAASTTPQQAYGYVFLHCKLIANEEATKVYLGRPWRAYAKVAFINCELGKHIRPEGWHNWDNAANESTAYYAEYGNTGAGANTAQRVAWSHQLNASEAAGYTIANIFGGWEPNTVR